MQVERSIRLQRDWAPILIALIGGAMVVVAIAADVLGIGGGAGFGSNQITLGLSGLVILFSGLIALPISQNTLIINSLLAIGAVLVSVASDLFTPNGLSLFPKIFLLASLAFAFLLLKISTLDNQKDNLFEALRAVLIRIDFQAFGKFLGIVLQLGLLVFLIQEYKLENQAFYSNLLQITFYGFVFNYFLSQQYRLPFFLFLSLASLFGIIGITNGLWILGIGIILIGIGHLPITFSLRIMGIVLVGGGLMLARADVVSTLIPPLIWPILGSMFMFRLIIYLYDLKHSKKPLNLWATFSYFFLFPNIVFPFFPVIDHSTFNRRYYNEEDNRIYQTGIAWIFLGVIQLICYRYINYYVVPAPDDITTAADLIKYIFSNYLLYVRISGQFHIIVGLLHLFGFNLPKSNDNYLLSAGFVDLWRRSNIYWKDFMQKIFFYPAYSWLTKRKISARLALILATTVVFISTWFFHAYQWFWLRGTFLLASYDIVFWVIIAVLVLGNTLYEAQQGRTRKLGKQGWNYREFLKQVFSNTATIFILTTLWAFWSVGSIEKWLELQVLAFSPEGIITFILSFILLGVFLGVVRLIFDFSSSIFQSAIWNHPTRTFALYSGLIAIIFFIGNPIVYSRLGETSKVLILDMTTQRLSDRDAELLQKGYYEDLTGIGQFNSELWDVYAKRPTDWPVIEDTEAAQRTDDIFTFKLNPSVSIVFHGEKFSTNRWRMRDKDYELVPPPKTFRVALLGPSFVMGSGVDDKEVFEWVLEDKLNEENKLQVFDRYEILNFAMSGYSALQELYTLEIEALSFAPNAVFYVSHQLEETVLVRNLVSRLIIGIDVPYSFMNEIAENAGVEVGMSQEEAERLLAPYGSELVSLTYQYIVKICLENDILPIWIFLPIFEGSFQDDVRLDLIHKADEAGFISIDLTNVYAGYEVSSLIVAEWDLHPNAMGHKLIAEQLYLNLHENEIISEKFGFSAP